MQEESFRDGNEDRSERPCDRISGSCLSPTPIVFLEDFLAVPLKRQLWQLEFDQYAIDDDVSPVVQPYRIVVLRDIQR